MIDGRYSLEEQIGVGGMASVWRATDTLLGRQLAIKRLSPHLKSDRAASERFRREGQAAAQLNHPGILTVFDAGEDQDGPWIAMELIEGETLANRLAAKGPMSLMTVASLIDQVAAAVDYAHGNGIVHRDIKPANLMIEPGGRIKLADFGIAKPLEDPATITSAGEMVGTISYVAPEIIGGQQASAASDIYSLATVAYEMLTGERPFAAASTAGLLEAIRSADGPILVGKVPEQVVAALTRAMAKDPSQRPVSAQAFAAELGQPSTLVLPLGVIDPDQPQAAPMAVTGSSDESTVLMSPAAADRGRQSARTVTPLPVGGGWRLSGKIMSVAGSLMFLVLIAALGLTYGGPVANEQGSQERSMIKNSPIGTTAVSITTVSTTAAEETPASLAAEISSLLAGLGPPGYKPKDVREVEDRVDRAVEQWEEGNRDESAESLDDAFNSIDEFPESQARDDLFTLLIKLAEAMGFEVDGEEAG